MSPLASLLEETQNPLERLLARRSVQIELVLVRECRRVVVGEEQRRRGDA